MDTNKKKSPLQTAYIIVLAVVFIVVGATVTLPRMSKARENAFRVEATRVIESATKALEKANDKELQITNSDNMCQVGNRVCFTVKELITLGLYDGKEKDYSGRVDMDVSNPERVQYALFFKKNDEFKIIGGIMKNYTTNGHLSRYAWNDEFEKCTCE